jgi:tungstate transport system substrate-binding protein
VFQENRSRKLQAVFKPKGGIMNKGRALFCVLLLTLLSCQPRAEEKILKMSTTTSTQASGLLDVLLPALEMDTGITVRVTAKGTGAAIQDGIDGNVDVIFVHDPTREEAFVRDGYGTKRYAVMHNDFVIVGPGNDPAEIKGLDAAAEALKKIAEVRAPFVSRGDDSGTHAKEQTLWRASGVALETKNIQFAYPSDSSGWYLSVGQGMGKTLTVADEKQAYTLADRGTYIKYKFGREVPIDLEILCEGGATLANPYGVIPVNPEKHVHVRYELAKAFAEWLVSPRGQNVIGEYKLLGKQLFFPDVR